MEYEFSTKSNAALSNNAALLFIVFSSKIVRSQNQVYYKS